MKRRTVILAVVLGVLVIAVMWLVSQPTTQYGGQLIPLTNVTQFSEFLTRGFATSAFYLTQTAQAGG